MGTNMVTDVSIDMCIEMGLHIDIGNSLGIGIDMSMNIGKGRFSRTRVRIFTDMGTIMNL